MIDFAQLQRLGDFLLHQLNQYTYSFKGAEEEEEEESLQSKSFATLKSVFDYNNICKSDAKNELV